MRHFADLPNQNSSALGQHDLNEDLEEMHHSDRRLPAALDRHSVPEAAIPALSGVDDLPRLLMLLLHAISRFGGVKDNAYRD